MRKLLSLLAIMLVVTVAAPAAARAPRANNNLPNPHGSLVRAGVGVTDATWHVGVGSGQYAAKDPNAASVVTQGEIDPYNHSNVQRRSYGVQSRLTYRTLVVEGSNGERVALVKSDSYLAQDMLTRRVGQILAQGDSGIGYGDILLQASHNHSSPYYMTPGWGVWLFQDAFEARAFEYHARQMAASIEAAVADLRPARMGATTVEHTIYKGNIVGGAVADDGSPAGYPDEHQDAGMTVVRFDDVSGPKPEPLAVYVNHGQHPESLDAYDLITADFLAPFERYVERDLGATLIFGQGDVGSAEGPYLRDNSKKMDDGVYRAWAHVGHAQTERGARYLADSVVDAWNAIGEGNVEVPFTTDFPVAALSRWVPGPLSHLYPSVSNCRSESTVEGNPGAPVLGLPDCARDGSNDPTNRTWESLKAHGVPVPDHYDAPGFTAVEENARILLQVFRLGEVVLASCSCEAQMDLIINLESRLDNVEGNIFNGYDWSEHCTDNTDGTWTCPRPGRDGETLRVSDEAFQRMRAQVNNDAAGWDLPENAVAANSEPSHPDQIWGNFTHTELPSDQGYAVAIGVGHAGDYMGYTVSYREYMNRDHYRKALTAYGPHTADYVNTRLMKMAGELKGGPAYEGEPHDTALAADEARQESLAILLGQTTSKAYDTWEASLPNDRGPAEPTTQPEDITRMSATTFSWRGGSNAVDNPVVRVERLAGKTWVPFADQTGEVQTMVRFPKGIEGVGQTYAGNTEWIWTANFEAYNAFPARLGSTPDGTYRYVVDGNIRSGGDTVAYQVTSDPFTVSPWTGVSAQDSRVEPNGAVSFSATSTYPRTYESPFRFIRDDGRTDVCKTCTFRPWASGAEVESAVVTVTRADGSTEQVLAGRDGDRWVAATSLGTGDRAAIAPGDLRDANGETNGAEIVLAE
jgi:hypothetical protein